MSKRVLLAMSGGVDSSVAALLLQREGYDVTGVFMRHGEESASSCAVNSTGESTGDNPLLPILQGRTDHKQGCCSASDALDARRVADKLSIPFYALDMQSDFKRIVDYFVDEYRSGRTPNPCVQCNNWIKFGRLFEYADGIGAEYVATGHYARMLPTGDPANPLGLHRGIDNGKDQAYVLAGIDRRFLPRMMLPIGGYQKSEIRSLAAEVGLRVADKRDSQEICFVVSGKHGEFVRQRSNEDSSGEIITTEGKVVGKHSGIESFTIGQRKGLGVAMHEPYFVTEIDREHHRIVIGRKESLQRTRLIAKDDNWLADVAVDTPFEASVQIRYNSAPEPAVVVRREKREFEVTFNEPIEGIAPGQLAVAFVGDRVMGGGWISSTS
jgi:tRNA-specific 2-thiouridylase